MSSSQSWLISYAYACYGSQACGKLDYENEVLLLALVDTNTENIT